MPKISPEISVWFDYPDDPCGGRIEIRHLKLAKVQELMSKATDAKVIHHGKDKAGQRQVETEVRVNNLKTNELLCEACVKNWENFQDEKGKVLPCNSKNVKLFAREDGFVEVIAGFRKELEEQVAEREAEARKNLKALPDG